LGGGVPKPGFTFGEKSKDFLFRESY